MAKRKNEKITKNKKGSNKQYASDADDDKKITRSIRPETIRHSVAVAVFGISGLFMLSAVGSAGPAGDWLYGELSYLFGFGFFLLPAIGILAAISLLKQINTAYAPLPKIIGIAVFFFSGLALISIVGKESGGTIGEIIADPLMELFDTIASVLLLSTILAASLLLILDAELPIARIKTLISSLRIKNASTAEHQIEEHEAYTDNNNGVTDEENYGQDEQLEHAEPPLQEQKTDNEIADSSTVEESSLPENKMLELKNKKPDITANNKNESITNIDTASYTPKSKYIFPPLNLLKKDRGKPGIGDIKANTNIIKRTLANFGINVEMDEISIGPSITRYALKPAEGVKLSRIIGLKNELSLALAAHPIRIEAPIPGKSQVGIEIPNSAKATVGLATLLSSQEFSSSDKPLLVALGKDISGKAHFANLSKMPHLLIAGATGSGKSVAIHAIITSLLFRNPPENLRFILIDPKRVELTLYNNIPHLVTPVVTGAKKAILALKGAAREMDKRYDILEAEKVRDIESYHKNILFPAIEAYDDVSAIGTTEDIINNNPRLPVGMPYIIIVIDELADIMAAYPRELESAIVRLAQMSRAVGIHLVLSTQRPSVNIITGLIKANIPARMALQVASQIDSRTILDSGGAESLLGSGDMLYLSGEMSKPKRLQSAFISENEVKQVVRFISEENEGPPPEYLSLSETEGSIFEDIFLEEKQKNDEEDELYEDAREIVLRENKASTSLLQRRLRIGYARAARLMDALEAQGIVSAQDGSKPREILVERYGDEKKNIED